MDTAKGDRKKGGRSDWVLGGTGPGDDFHNVSSSEQILQEELPALQETVESYESMDEGTRDSLE